MKTSVHSIISDHVFRGKSTGKSNDIARIIYGAKFFNNDKSLTQLIRIACNDIDPKGIDIIVPINTRDSRYNIPYRIAKQVAAVLKVKFMDALSSANTKASAKLKGRNVLLLDDVIYTGRTLSIASAACTKVGAKSVKAFAIAHSKKFKNE